MTCYVPKHLSIASPKPHFVYPSSHFLFLCFLFSEPSTNKTEKIMSIAITEPFFQRLWRGSEAFGTLLLLVKNMSIDSLKRCCCLGWSWCWFSCPLCCDVLFIPKAEFCFPNDTNSRRINTISFINCIFLSRKGRRRRRVPIMGCAWKREGKKQRKPEKFMALLGNARELLEC